MATASATHTLKPPAVITKYSELGKPIEKMYWWAPFGWLLVLVFTTIVLAIILAMSPLIILEILIHRMVIGRYKYHRDPADLKVALIGAGWGALQATEHFKKIGTTNVDIFERSEDLGGTWTRNLRYKDLQIHGSMTVTSFDHYPYSTDPDVQKGKVLAEEVERYIHRFADDKDLRKHCKFNSNVDTVHYDSKTKKGSVSITDTVTGEKREFGGYDQVIWASMSAFGSIPHLKGAENFKGKQIHTIDYKPEEFDDIIKNNKKVVVVGGGKAACDVVLSLHRAGYDNFTWLMRKPYLFYRYESLFHNGSFFNKVRGLSYLCTMLATGISKKLSAALHWGSGYIYTFGKPHTDFHHFHGGVMCATQRADIADVPYTLGDTAGFSESQILLKDGSGIDADVVIWATGNSSGIDTLKLEKDGQPFELDKHAKLYNHFIVPKFPVLASSTALWTTFGPQRGTNTADLTVFHHCVRGERDLKQMEKVAGRQMSKNSIVHSFIWAHNLCWLQEWVYFHIDLMIAGVTPLESFMKHALEVFIMSQENPLRFNILPKRGSK